MENNSDDASRCICGFDAPLLADHSTQFPDTGVHVEKSEGINFKKTLAKVMFAFIISFILVIISYFIGESPLSVFIFPGLIVNLLVSGNIHQGFEGVVGVLVTIVVSTFTWFLIIISFMFISVISRSSIKKKDENV